MVFGNDDRGYLGVEVGWEVWDFIGVNRRMRFEALLGFRGLPTASQNDGVFYCLIRYMFSERVMVSSTDISGFHCSSFLRTEDATNHEAPPQPENLAVVAYPVFVRKLFDAVTTLMHWDVA